MKKLLALLLAVVMMFSLVACGEKDDDDEGGSKKKKETTASQSTESSNATENKEPEESKDTTGTKEPEENKDATGTKEPEQTEKPKENTFDVGSTASGKYVNEFVGITCSLGSDWTFMTDAQIQENNKQALGLMGDDYAELIKNAQVFTDMMATNVNQRDTLSVSVEKLPNAAMTEAQYVALSKASLKSALESAGMTSVTVNSGEETFAGAKHAYITVSAKYAGLSVYERLALVKCDNYMAIITVCTWDTDGCKAILDLFKPITL